MVDSHDTLTKLVAAGDENRPAVILAETGNETTYGELLETIHSLAGRLAALGVSRGDRVALAIRDAPDLLHLVLAVTTLGAAASPLNPGYTRTEFAFYLKDVRPDLLLLTQGDVDSARDATDGLRTADVHVGKRGLDLYVAGRPQERQQRFEGSRPDDIALLLHTSGTTSRPKQVPLLHRNAVKAAKVVQTHYSLGKNDVSYSMMPLFHVHGLVASVLATLSAGGSVVVPRRFRPRQFWSQARRFRTSWFSAAPTLHQMILDRMDERGPPPSLRFARSCSSSLSRSLMQRAENALGVPMLEAYGMTEASHQIASNPLPPGERRQGSVGIPTGVEIRIVDEQGRDVSCGSGEIVIRGPTVTSGYLPYSEANADMFHDGWLRTGDRGRLDDGYLWLEGRIKEMILRGGENISPYEVEAVLASHPAVADTVCFGVRDEKYGERVAAAVVLLREVDVRDLIRHCRERLAAFKVPDAIHVLESIPRTPTGKPQRTRIAALLSEAAE